MTEYKDVMTIFQGADLTGRLLGIESAFFVSYTKFSINYHYRRFYSNERRMDKFAGGKWESDIDVRDFIQRNYTPYDGDQSFLEGPTEATDKLWGELKELQKEERAKGGVLDMETEVVSGITAYGAAYLDKDLEKVVGLQTDKPLKRAFMPYGGIKMAEQSCQMYGYTPSPKLHEIFTKYHKTHNQVYSISTLPR